VPLANGSLKVVPPTAVQGLYALLFVRVVLPLLMGGGRWDLAVHQTPATTALSQALQLPWCLLPLSSASVIHRAIEVFQITFQGSHVLGELSELSAHCLESMRENSWIGGVVVLDITLHASIVLVLLLL
jgi:hypothetical protein